MQKNIKAVFTLSSLMIGLLPTSIYTQKIPDFLYKAISREAFLKSSHKKELLLSSFDKDFIHFATEEQLPKIIQKFFANQIVHILKIKTSKLPGTLILEKNPGGETKYYHLYDGSIPKKAIVSEVLLENIKI